MRLRGGYNILLAGKPSAEVHVLPEPRVLYLPLSSRRFIFSEIRVNEGQRVKPGHVLAEDPKNYYVPLVAPRAGTVRLREAEGHITLEDVAKVPEEPYPTSEDLPHIPKDTRPVVFRRYKLLVSGAWQFFRDAYTGAVPDPTGIPKAIIVSTVHLEPFVAAGNVQIAKRLSSFTRGVEYLQSLLEYQPIFLILPDVHSEVARRVRDTLRGRAWVKLVAVPRKYPFDNFAVLARWLGLRNNREEPVWALDTAGVLATDRVLTLSRPPTVRIISLGGPAVRTPVHLRAMPGYPLSMILNQRISYESYRVINGGVLTGQAIPAGQLGLDVECQGLTVLPEASGNREFMAFARPGFDRRSYGNCFVSLLRRPFRESLNTALRGERRPCIGCAFCEEVCPVSIMPHLIHKYLYRDALEEAERVRVDLCVGCGLCSFVCPSKIELTMELLTAQERIRRELRTEEASL